MYQHISNFYSNSMSIYLGLWRLNIQYKHAHTSIIKQCSSKWNWKIYFPAFLYVFVYSSKYVNALTGKNWSVLNSKSSTGKQTLRKNNTDWRQIPRLKWANISWIFKKYNVKDLVVSLKFTVFQKFRIKN